MKAGDADKASRLFRRLLSANPSDPLLLLGFGIAAHPGSPKPELQWTDWTVPLDGLEWLNADSEWRDEFWANLGGVLLTYGQAPSRPRSQSNPIAARKTRASRADPVGLGCTRSQLIVAG